MSPYWLGMDKYFLGARGKALRVRAALPAKRTTGPVGAPKYVRTTGPPYEPHVQR